MLAPDLHVQNCLGHLGTVGLEVSDGMACEVRGVSI